MPRGPRRGSKKKPRLSRGFKMTLQRAPTHRHHSAPDNLRCALSGAPVNLRVEKAAR